MKQAVSKRHSPRARKAKVDPIRWPKKEKRRILPAWVPVATALGLCAMLVLTINFRAYSELSKESRQYEELNGKIQQATSENLSLQEEIYYLKNDPNTVEREARKFGFAAPKEAAPKEEPKTETKTDQKPLEREAKKTEPATPKQEKKVSKAGETDKAEKSVNRQSPTRK
jgi:cell division protein FtsB